MVHLGVHGVVHSDCLGLLAAPQIVSEWHARAERRDLLETNCHLSPTAILQALISHRATRWESPEGNQSCREAVESAASAVPIASKIQFHT
jgi:hypothetical protein